MSDATKLELTVQVDPQQANAALGSFNKTLSDTEQSAVRAARNSSTAMDGMTASIVKGATAGNLLADSIKSVVSWLKEWSIGAVEAEAHVERLQVGMLALSKANGVAAESAMNAVASFQKAGFATADATAAVNRLIVAGINVDNAKKLATMANDVAAISGTTRPEAAAALMNAVEYGNARDLRRIGLPKIDFEGAIKQRETATGYKVTEDEATLIRLNLVLQERIRIQGAGAAADKTAEGQAEKLRLEIEALKLAIGQDLQGEYKKLLTAVREFIGYIKEHKDQLEHLAEVFLVLGGALAVAAIAFKIREIVTAMTGLNAVLALNPIGVAAGLAVIGGAILYSRYSDQDKGWADRQKALNEKKGILQVRPELGDAASNNFSSLSAFSYENGVLSPKGGAAKPEPRELSEHAKEVLKIEAETAKEAADAWGKEHSELAKIIAEHDQHIVQLRTEGKLNDTIRKNIDSRMMAEWTWMNKIWNKKQADLQMDKSAKEAEERFAVSEINTRGGPLGPQQSAAAEYSYGTWVQGQAGAAGDLQTARDARLRSVELADAEALKTNYQQTIRAKVGLEQDKLAIEIDYLQRAQAAQEQAIIARYGDEAAAATDPYMRASIEARGHQEVQRSQTDVNVAIEAARESSALKEAKDLESEYQKHFDAIKNSAGTLFDALISNTKNFGQTLMATIRTAFLTPIKEALSAWIAGMLMGATAFTGGGARGKGGWMVGAGGGSGAAGPAAGILGFGGGLFNGGAGWAPGSAGFGGGQPGAGGMTVQPDGSVGFGASPSSGAGGGFGAVGPAAAILGFGGGVVNGPPGWDPAWGGYGGGPGMSAATPPFWGGAGGGSMAGGSSMGGGGFGMGGLGQIGGIANLFKGGGGLSGFWSRASGQSYGTAGVDGQPGVDMGGTDSTGGGAFSGGVGGIGGAALMAGGTMLALDGWKRGGGMGMLEMTGGGAAIGEKFGGPLGAAIGAGVGALIGGLHWAFGSNPTEDMKNDVKNAYGVKIDDTFAKSLVAEAGKMDFRVFLQQDKVHQEIMLYAQMTKSSVSGGTSGLYTDNVARGVNLTESGGSLYQSATYSNGGAYGYQSSLQSMGGFQTLTPNVTVVANMDGRATTNFLGGAAVSATGQSQGRTALASNLLSPAMGTI
jgi:hypothetical protein